MTSEGNAGLAFMATAVVLIALSWDGLSGPLVFDDFPNLAPLAEAEAPFPYRSFIFENSSGVLGRSVSMSTFAMNHWIRGEFNTSDLKITNLAIHIANGLLLFVIMNLLLDRVLARSRRVWLAGIVSMLWLLSPINVGVVFYAIQRMTLLSCLFVFLGIICYVQCRRTTGGRWVRRLALLSACLICWILASYSKENGVLLPLFLLLMEFYFFASNDRRRPLRIAMAFIFIGGCIAAYYMHSTGLLNYNNRNFTLEERLWTQPIVITHYVRDLLLPVTTDVGLFNDDFPIIRTPWNALTIGYAGGILLLLGLGLFSTANLCHRPIWAGVWFYFVGHLAESTVMPLEMYFEHRNYLPSAGLYLAVVFSGYLVLSKFAKLGALKVIVPFLVVFWFTIISYQKVQAWTSWPSVVTNIYQHHPKSVRAGLEMASLLVHAGQPAIALKVNGLNGQFNEERALNIAAQRFYIYCIAGAEVDEVEYEMLSGSIYPTGMAETSTALELLLEAASRGSCENIDVERVIRAVARMIDMSLDSRLISAIQAWNVDYYVVEYFRTHAQLDLARSRVVRSMGRGNVKAKYYLEDIITPSR